MSASESQIDVRTALKQGLAQLREAAGPVPCIHRGCDFHLTPENIQDALAHSDDIDAVLAGLRPGAEPADPALLSKIHAGTC